ncbi:MAG: sulfotransferase domain-containing protein [Candidatus Algichlamydia australiensis]|nr:sulfotransferase domain-containing protein [Chlamydiales bacterium]
MFIRIFFLAFALTNLGFATEKDEPRVAVLSYFRSGTCFFVYSLTQLTGRTWEKNVLPKWVTQLKDPENAASEKPPFFHQHHCINLKKLNPQRDKLIFLLRNNKENLIGRFGPEKFENLFHSLVKNNGLPEATTYYRNIAAFDLWNPKNRLLIYYKDLIQNPEEVFERALHFLGEDFSRWDNFIENFEEHRAYCHNKRGGRTGGKFIHFSNQVPRDRLIAYDEKVEKTYPRLYEKYLKPFETL